MSEHHINPFRWAFERTLFYVKARKLPAWPYRYRSKLKTLKIYVKSLKENPLRAIRFFPKFFYHRKGFLLLVFGPRVFKDTIMVCESLRVRPFLLFGTLRGYILKKEFLSKGNSGDMDFGLFEDDYQKAPLIKEALCKKGYLFCQDIGYELLLVHPEFPSLFIDFFCIYKKNAHAVITTEIVPDKKIMYSQYFPMDIFEELHHVLFHNVKVLIPAKYEEFLSLHYGESWKTGRKLFFARGSFAEKIEPLELKGK